MNNFPLHSLIGLSLACHRYNRWQNAIEVIPKRSAKIQYSLIKALMIKVSTIWAITEGRMLKQLLARGGIFTDLFSLRTKVVLNHRASDRVHFAGSIK